MSKGKTFLLGVLALALVAGVAAPAGATTLLRAGLDDLVAANGTIVIGEVLDAYSYWNQDGTFILTDARIIASEVLQGDPQDRVFTVTLLGGTVGDLTVLIPGGADLAPEASYLLFLDEGDLPGARRIRTVPFHSQGVFELREAPGGSRAVSQAVGQHLVPDAAGNAQPPGGAEGLPLAAMIQTIHELSGR